MKPIIDHIQITVKDMNVAEPFYDKLMPGTKQRAAIACPVPLCMSVWGGGALWEYAHSLLLEVECNCLSRIACSSPHFFSSCKAGTNF